MSSAIRDFYANQRIRFEQHNLHRPLSPYTPIVRPQATIEAIPEIDPAAEPERQVMLRVFGFATPPALALGITCLFLTPGVYNMRLPVGMDVDVARNASESFQLFCLNRARRRLSSFPTWSLWWILCRPLATPINP